MTSPELVALARRLDMVEHVLADVQARAPALRREVAAIRDVLARPSTPATAAQSAEASEITSS